MGKKATTNSVTSLRLDRAVVDRCKKLQQAMQDELAEEHDLAVQVKIPLSAVIDRAVREALVARDIKP